MFLNPGDTPTSEACLRISDISTQAHSLVGEYVTLIEIARAVKGWARSRGQRQPRWWTQGQVDEVLLRIIDEVAQR